MYHCLLRSTSLATSVQCSSLWTGGAFVVLSSRYLLRVLCTG